MKWKLKNSSISTWSAFWTTLLSLSISSQIILFLKISEFWIEIGLFADLNIGFFYMINCILQSLKEKAKDS
ncbi:hypothetical protein [Rubeoparvulum massiliense]|uniref:hypothetical protein n=1 Tax=Rubeoparvulum massiliense TaxID=1631346 RepID=UPI00065E64F2|nr:hypothetical protein [Rubeoparvulum massiliense]